MNETNQLIEKVFSRHVAKVLGVMEEKNVLTNQIRSILLRSYRFTFEDVMEVLQEHGTERNGNGKENGMD